MPAHGQDHARAIPQTGFAALHHPGPPEDKGTSQRRPALAFWVQSWQAKPPKAHNSGQSGLLRGAEAEKPSIVTDARWKRFFRRM
jgi:hypothetical protein